MKGKKKILFIHHGQGIGGAPTSMFQLIEALNKDKFDIKILFIYKSPLLIEICKEKGISYSVLGGFFFKKIYRYWKLSDADIRNKILTPKKLLIITLLTLYVWYSNNIY